MNDDDVTALSPEPLSPEFLSPEALDRALAQTDHLWSSSLAALLSAPDDLAARTADEVRQTLLDRSTIVAAGDLVAVGWHTLRILFAESERET